MYWMAPLQSGNARKNRSGNPCQICEGSGEVPDKWSITGYCRCEDCAGSGIEDALCKGCGGVGTIKTPASLTGFQTCSSCSGRGWIP